MNIQNPTNIEAATLAIADLIDRAKGLDAIYDKMVALSTRYIYASDDLLISASVSDSNVSTTYVKEKEFLVAGVSGTVRVKFGFKSTGTGDLAYARIYINDVAVGTEQTETGSEYVTKTEDIDIEPGDLVQLWFKTDNAARNVYWSYCALYGVSEQSFKVTLDT